MNIKKQYFCNNCGKLGHLFHQCKVPITSIGIIPIRIVKKYNPCLNKYENSIELLIIKRKDTLSFVDFMRGKYSIEDKNYITNLLNNMTVNERQFILNNEFDVMPVDDVVCNTSFNINNEPIVSSVEDAYRCFLVTDLDYLVCGNFILKKEDQY